MLHYAHSLGCYKGCAFPRLEERLGRTEAKFAIQLEQEEAARLTQVVEELPEKVEIRDKEVVTREDKVERREEEVESREEEVESRDEEELNV